jgi:hypothetical protein
MDALVVKQRAHSPEAELDSANYPRTEIAAPITVYSRRETDESYTGVIGRERNLRIVNCPDNLQWIAQCFKGGQWRNKSFHCSRQSLIRRYGPLEMILPLPEHHNGLEDEKRCRMCGRIRGKPRGGLARHLFCLIDRTNGAARSLGSAAFRGL